MLSLDSGKDANAWRWREKHPRTHTHSQKKIGDYTTTWNWRPDGWKMGSFILRSFFQAFYFCLWQTNKQNSLTMGNRERGGASLLQASSPFIVPSSIPHQQPAGSGTKSHPPNVCCSAWTRQLSGPPALCCCLLSKIELISSLPTEEPPH